MWTQAWRRLHKKVNLESTAKRRVRKVIKENRLASGVDKALIEKNKLAAEARKLLPKVAKVAGAKPVVVEQASVAEAKAKKKALQLARKKSAAGPKISGQAAKHGAKGR